MVNRECISPRGPALRWGRVWPFGSGWVAPLVTLGDRPPQVEGNGGGLNYSAWTWAALGLLMSPDTLCESPSNPSCAPQPCLRLSLHVRHEQHGLFNHTEKKKQVTRKHHYQVHTACVCVCMCKTKRGLCSKVKVIWHFGVKIYIFSYIFSYPSFTWQRLLEMDVEVESVKNVKKN